ncbi:electron transport complex subunit RsxG [Photobacterium angustum]|uniref:electron transport complex subunit RsxG n=1 Tax=Photobacterium angustum TaxID=661 RepID=UPI0005E87FE3|nr:electron transport complex subunit RsxG [Photobacterium angustum]KJF95469.1 electron transporter RnfG [Photobacterium angustum]PSW83091.1 electron transport complex subunit RsxG [Photobacterium angustum]
MFNAMKKNGAILAIFACLATALVALTNYLTEDRIAEQQRLQLLDTLNQVIPVANHDNLLYKSCTLVRDHKRLGTLAQMPAYIAKKDNKPVGVAIEGIAPDGYSGAIKIIVGLDMKGVITGVRVLQQNETPGLGDKIEATVSNWIYSFNGKRVTGDNDPSFKVRKDGGEFDQFTGATITPRAVVKAVKNISLYWDQNQDKIINQPLDCAGE